MNSVKSTLFALTCLVLVLAALPLHSVAAEPDAKAVEFFEAKIRPLLVKRCFECHGPEADRLEGGLLMTSHKSLVEGGDTGATIVPGEPDESLLIESINYEGDYEMPPIGKMPDEEIALLTKWVEMGAPWPENSAGGPDPRAKFDLDARKKSHWAWQPIRDPSPPKVKQSDWAIDSLDQFILAKLEAEGLAPNKPAAANTLVRRLYFDLIGLPPTPEEVDKWTAELTDSSGGLHQAGLEKLVDHLLASPHFGERWGRHWLDLMRYAESRGHEFDYNVPNPWEYRDYVVRALNADVPYDQFVVEHVAGDLLETPRRHPSEGYNESIIGTGFWHLGEWVHSPVDIRGDECDRLDNQLDVFSKTFLGMTVACARCHDHKFDAISQRDYYALAGFVQSSAYRLARFETLDHNRQIAEELAELRARSGKEFTSLTAQSQRPVLEKFDTYLLAASEVVNTPFEAQAAKESKPHVFADFEGGSYHDWKIEGEAFGQGPVTGTLPRQQKVSGWNGKYYVNTWIKGDGPQGKATSPTFKITHRYITMLVGGGSFAGQTCVNLVSGADAGGKVLRTATGKNNERLDPVVWDVADLIGQQVHIQIVDAHSGGWGHVNLDHIVFTDNAKDAGTVAPQLRFGADHVAAIAKKHGVNADVLAALASHLVKAKDDASNPLHLWARLVFDKNQDETHLKQQIANALRDAAARSEKPSDDTELIIDFGQLTRDQWFADGHAFGIEPTQVGQPLLSGGKLAGIATHGAARRDLAFKDLKNAGGAMNDHGKIGNWQRVGQSIRTPTFTVKDGPVHYLVRGAGRAFAVVDSHRLIQGPLHGEVLTEWNDDTQGKLRWVTHNLTRHQGHRVHIEFSPRGASELEVLQVVQGPRAPAIPSATPLSLLAKDHESVESMADLAKTYRDTFVSVNDDLQKGIDPNREQATSIAAIADWMISNGGLFSSANKEDEKLTVAESRFAEVEKELQSKIKNDSRLAMAMWDGFPEDEQFLVRGNHGSVKGTVPRRMLTALGGEDSHASQFSGSGRLDLARRMVDPANPLTSRVMVNRIWHHLMGVGIVPTPDNFGVLGLEPTHPELLDHLATRFMREGWSVKQMIKTIVMSRTYQMSSHPTKSSVKDPANKWLHRMRIRRLEAETIRDSVLAVSGRLDRKMYGPSVPVHLTAFMTGRGRPGQGPLDGNGRRSFYISIRRNFLSPMMLAFDMPQPSAPTGRRTVSNVPAQALIMMNDPLVIQQAERWAKQLLAQSELDASARLELMYRQAFARGPTEDEKKAALDFLREQAQRHGIPADQAITSPQTWADLCHVMFNVKEFIFIN